MRWVAPVRGYMHACMKDDKKPGFLDQLKRFVDPKGVQDDPNGPQPISSQMPFGQPRSPRRPGQMSTDRLQATVSTARLEGTSRTAELGPADPLSGVPQDELSVRRLAMIDDFMNNRVKLERMKNPTYMYKIVSDERAYQAWLLTDLKQRLYQQSNRRRPEAMELEQQIRSTSAIMQNLFKVLKYITGKKGHTGGTDFLT